MSLIEAVDSLYRENRRQFFACALAVTRRADLAEDAVHDAFSRLFALRVAPRQMKGYAFRAVRNSAIDALRAAGRKQSFLELASREPLFNGTRPHAANATEMLEIEAAQRALERLDDGDQEVVVLHIYAGLTFKEMAAALERPSGTVATQYRRALEKMRALLEDEK